MEYAPITDYPEEDINFMSIMNNTEFSNIEPICVQQKIYNKSIEIKDLLIDSLQGVEILNINNTDYKNEEIDKIIETIDSFYPKFMKLQDELDDLNINYNKELKHTKNDIIKIKSSIKFMEQMEEDYKLDESIRDIINKLNDYSKRILENNKLKNAKDMYIKKRKELNSYLYFIQKLNRWNTTSICPICITNRIDSYCNPCGHTACKNCLERKPSTPNNINNNKCPICREYISEIRKLFFI
mgnify:CR=1 FL=1|tara:strand:- start:950 stop:1672 length:723 start_codon:yes stop_codon:yes gene_type:complete